MATKIAVRVFSQPQEQQLINCSFLSDVERKAPQVWPVLIRSEEYKTRQSSILHFKEAQLSVCDLGYSKLQRGNQLTMQVTLYGMMDFVHHQLMSCLTGQVNAILQNNQTYDPGVNFGKSRTEHLLLHYAVENGVRSIPIALGSVPVLPLPAAIRSNIHSLLKETKI